ncbi:MAG: DUF3883 domain-containing protein [Planctomycetes bacterium]|nr:DUF3883 domain-containing protein [Planctomycetota bacterium]
MGEEQIQSTNLRPLAILVCNIQWFREYLGQENISMRSGFRYVKDYPDETLWESWNAKPINGFCYGYVKADHGIDTRKLGAKDRESPAKGVPVIWLATKNGRRVASVWCNATVYPYHRERPDKIKTTAWGNDAREPVLYIVKATQASCRFFAPSARPLLDHPIGMTGKNYGRTVFYCERENRVHRSRYNILQSVLAKYSPNTESAPPPEQPAQAIQPADQTRSKDPARQADPEHRRKVERAAERVATKHFEGDGYEVLNVSAQKVGWDLTAKRGDTTLQLEVKGSSADSVSFDLTPNEYEKLLSHTATYRMCIVQRALAEEPHLLVFKRVRDSAGSDFGYWEEESSGIGLSAKVLPGLRVTLDHK